MRKLYGAGHLCLLLVCSTSAFATSQCPAEFGPKDPSINALGWLVVVVGIVLGGLLLGYAIKRSQGIPMFKRIAMIALGIVGLALICVGGLALAIAFFFLQC